MAINPDEVLSEEKKGKKKAEVSDAAMSATMAGGAGIAVGAAAVSMVNVNSKKESATTESDNNGENHQQLSTEETQIPVQEQEVLTEVNPEDVMLEETTEETDIIAENQSPATGHHPQTGGDEIYQPFANNDRINDVGDIITPPEDDVLIADNDIIVEDVEDVLDIVEITLDGPSVDVPPEEPMIDDIDVSANDFLAMNDNFTVGDIQSDLI